MANRTTNSISSSICDGSSRSASRLGWCFLLHKPCQSFIHSFAHFLVAHPVIRCSQPAVSISTPALLESSSNPGPPTCDASTSPVPSPKSHGDTRQHDGVPARLTGRHFLGKRESEADCKVCSQQKRKRAEEDEKERKKKKITEGEESEKNAEEANSHQEEKEEDHKSEIPRSRTPYYCKTCAGEPSLCAVPCFELYHTRLIYRTAPELETQGGPPPWMQFKLGMSVWMFPWPITSTQLAINH